MSPAVLITSFDDKKQIQQKSVIPSPSLLYHSLGVFLLDQASHITPLVTNRQATITVTAITGKCIPIG